jgi:threonine synthase
MVSVQSSGCAPVVRAFERGLASAEPWENARTIASGLRVPKAIGDFLMLRALYESRGTAVTADDSDLVDAIRACGRLEGLFLCPEGAACIPALRSLIGRKWIAPDEIVVMFNTASGLKYLDVMK